MNKTENNGYMKIVIVFLVFLDVYTGLNIYTSSIVVQGN